jgi:hypothetical protein
MVHHHHGRRQSRLFNLMLLNGELLLAESLSLCGTEIYTLTKRHSVLTAPYTHAFQIGRHESMDALDRLVGASLHIIIVYCC